MLHKINEWLTNKKSAESKDKLLSPANVPRHVAIIMDGNGRWAKHRGLPRVAGHRAGMRAVIEVTRAAHDLGVEILTLYAFSTENWKRPKDEVDYILKLPQDYLATELEELVQKNVQIRLLGSEEGLPSHTLDALLEARTRTRNNTGMILNFALNYGSRAEITHMVKEIASKVKQGNMDIEEINEEMIGGFLLSKGLSDPDLLIRTKEIRLSNFMLWQLAYTELWFEDIYWPDFGREHFEKAIREYQRRVRRYGTVK